MTDHGLSYTFFSGTLTQSRSSFFFFFNDPAPPEISPLPLHAPLPISIWPSRLPDGFAPPPPPFIGAQGVLGTPDRKSTRLNSSHGYISYAVFCLKKKKMRP